MKIEADAETDDWAMGHCHLGDTILGTIARKYLSARWRGKGKVGKKLLVAIHDIKLIEWSNKSTIRSLPLKTQK